MRHTVVTLFVGMVVLSGGSAYAQEKGQVGLTMGFPTNVGVLWQVTDRVAIRPAFSFSHNWSESTTESGTQPTIPIPSPPGFVTFDPATRTTSSSNIWTTGVDLSVLLYLGKWDNVRTYVAPAYGYRRSSVTSESSSEILAPLPPGFPPDLLAPRSFNSKSESDSHVGAATLGVQFTPHRRFSVFGELGVRYSQSGEPSVSSVVIVPGIVIPNDNVRRSKSQSVGTSTAVGIVLYLK